MGRALVIIFLWLEFRGDLCFLIRREALPSFQVTSCILDGENDKFFLLVTREIFYRMESFTMKSKTLTVREVVVLQDVMNRIKEKKTPIRSSHIVSSTSLSSIVVSNCLQSLLKKGYVRIVHEDWISKQWWTRGRIPRAVNVSININDISYIQRSDRCVSDVIFMN